MWTFLLPLLIGFVLNGASSFTAAYSRRWGERGGRLASFILRNVIGIPLWVVGLALAARAPGRTFPAPNPGLQTVGWSLVAVGCVVILWALLSLGWRAVMPSVRDTVIEHGPYARGRHPIYSGMLLEFAGLSLLSATEPMVVACALGVGWLVVQARLEEIDLLQRAPAYWEYMARVPALIPRISSERRT